MRLDTRPLLDTAADAQLFVDRKDELDRLLRALRSDLNTLVVGDRGMGKTSLLRHAAYKLREEEEPVVFVDAGLATSLGDLLVAIQDAIGRTPHLGEVVQESFQRLVHPVATPAADAIAAVRRLDIGRRLVVMMDNLSTPELGYTLFGKLRDELWRLPHTWAVTASSADQMQLLAPPADAFFAATIALPPLDARAAKKLLAKRDGDPALVDLVGESGEGNPRKLLEVARAALVEDASLAELLQHRAELETAVSELG